MRFRRYLRNRALGLTRRAVAPAARWRQRRTPPRLELPAVRRRLELLLAGMYGQPMRVGAESAIDRLAAGRARPSAMRADILLPHALDAHDGVEAAAARYRLLAIEQAERLVRGSATLLIATTRLVRDLYTLAEAAAVSRAIVRRAPGLAGVLAEQNARELARRPNLGRLHGMEREVEVIARALLGDKTFGAALPVTESSQESLAWAEERAARMFAAAPPHARYRGLPGMDAWRLAPVQRKSDLFPPLPSPGIGEMRSASAAAPAAHGNRLDETEDAEGTAGEPQAAGTASLVAPDAAARSAEGSEGTAAAPTVREAQASIDGVTYPEWDTYAGVNKPDAVTVHDEPAAEGSSAWAEETLASHAAIVRQVRARFGLLRAHRTRLRAQRSGDELDLDACVRAMVDLRMRRVPSDRLYLHNLPARRTLAIALLVDVSGSTRATISSGQTILDVERMTVLLASEALDALGDPYAVLAFSGCGAHDVQIRTVKRFTGDARDVVHRRIAGLAAMDNTRLGAAVRHATSVLNAQPAEQRLLLMVSDGKPNDVYGYQGAYAIEDSRRALSDARASGVHAFCLTVDREETEYLPHLFGASGYRVLRAPEQLPAALLKVVEQLLPR
jgi:nitric oxide reductase NorD protein